MASEEKFREIVMVRHGENEWAVEDRYCGWMDDKLTAKGFEEALNAANILKEEKLQFGLAFTSQLKRAEITLETILNECEQKDIPVFRSWQLNERHYGALTGQTESEIVAKYGDSQLKERQEPSATIIVAHGASLGAIVQHLDGLSNDELMGLNLPRGLPFVYKLNEDLKPVSRMTFLGNKKIIKQAIEDAENQPEYKFFIG